MVRGAARSMVALAITLATIAPVAAQTTTGKIVGTVREAGAGPLAGVEVRATSAALQRPRITSTTADGRFVIPALLPGTYLLTLSGAGLVPMRLEDVEVSLGGSALADAVMSRGTLSESMTVTAEPPLFDSTSADNVVIVLRKLVDGLPLVTRDYSELAKLVPSVTATEVNMTSGRGPGTPSFRGEGQYGDNYLVDGLTGRNPSEYTPGTPIPLGAIQEVQLVAVARFA